MDLPPLEMGRRMVDRVACRPRHRPERTSGRVPRRLHISHGCDQVATRTSADCAAGAVAFAAVADSGEKHAEGERADGPRSLDGVTAFMGLRWVSPDELRMAVRPELLNGGGILSGVATYAMVDYCMGSTLWVQTSAEEGIATVSISINYVQTALSGELSCRSRVDRRNRTIAVLSSEVRGEDGALIVTAIGSYSIFARERIERLRRRAGL